MLSRLFINNYALIEKADIELENGFTVITGETGAGKSILLGAIGLILGERADYSVLRHQEKKCVIEAEFNIESFNLQGFLEDNDIDYEANSILRREITSSGKSRAFINDTPVKLSLLKEFGDQLINIHSQNQSHQLHNESYIEGLIDAYLEDKTLLTEYKNEFSKYQVTKKELEIAKEQLQKLKAEEDYIRFQYSEMESIDFDQIDFDDLQEKVEIGENQERIVESLSFVLGKLENDQSGIISGLREIQNQLSSISSLSVSFNNLEERISSARIELDDLRSEIENELEKAESFGSNTESTAILDEINRLLQKHFLQDINQLKELKTDLKQKIELSDHSDEKINELESTLKESSNKLNDLGEALFNKRKEKATILEKELDSLLNELVLPNAEVRFDLLKLSDFKPNGMNSTKMLFNANLGGQLKEVSKSASGGETSRLMLAIQYLLSQKKALSSLIFDEIDTGISGEIASKIGGLLNKISNNLQVISITHLPQVASKGDQHFVVSKKDVDNQTITSIKRLSNEERINEIAKMLSGDSINEASIENAKSLLTVR